MTEDTSNRSKNVYTFQRREGFYPLILSDDEEAIRNAKNNPGTIRVTNESTRHIVFEAPNIAAARSTMAECIDELCSARTRSLEYRFDDVQEHLSRAEFLIEKLQEWAVKQSAEHPPQPNAAALSSQ